MDAVDLITNYIDMGVAVFPLYGIDADGRCQCRRDCGRNAGKHPRLGLAHGPDDPRRSTCRGECGSLGHGLHDATTDPGQVAEWLAQFPDGNWAIRPPEGILVLDVDPRNDGDIELRKLEQEHGILPTTLTAQTGSGGLHLWFTYAGPTRGKLCKGVDIKTHSGYLVAPPSRHAAGGRYFWLDQSPAAYAPDWVKAIMNPPRVARLRPAGGRGGSGRGLVEFVAARQFGEINDGLYWAACRADEQGVLDDAMVEALVDAAGRAAGPHADAAGEQQSRRTIESARRRPADELRQRRASRHHSTPLGAYCARKTGA